MKCTCNITAYDVPRQNTAQKLFIVSATLRRRRRRVHLVVVALFVGGGGGGWRWRESAQCMHKIEGSRQQSKSGEIAIVVQCTCVHYSGHERDTDREGGSKDVKRRGKRPSKGTLLATTWGQAR